MIVVRVELHSGETGRAKEIARAEIWNDGTGTDQSGNYCVVARDDTGRVIGGRVHGYPRLERLSIWELVAYALRASGCGHWRLPRG